MTSSHNQKKLTFITNVKTNWPLLVLPYVALVLLHVLLSLGMQYPNIWDEFGYLGRARYLAGVAHIPHDISRYHFGYSLFLLPSFWIFSDTYYIYKAVLITNSLLMSALYFPIYYILHTLMNNDKRLSAAISIACCLYPAFVLQSNLAWSENAFIPFYAFFIASFGAFIKHKSYPSIVLFSFLGAFLYTIHPRALPIIPIVICYMGVLTGFRELPKRQLFLSLSLLFCIYFLTNSVNDHFLVMDSGETSREIIRQKTFRLLSPSNLLPLVLEASGQFLYLLLASNGLFFVGLLYACTILLHKWKRAHSSAFSDIDFNMMSLLILSSFAIFTASNLQMINGERADKLFYGRYNEGFMALYLMFGLICLHSKATMCKRPILTSSLTSFVILILMLVVVGGHGFQTLSKVSDVGNVNAINVLGIYPFIGFLRKLDIKFISVVSIVFIFLLMYTFKYRFRLGLALATLYFCVVSLSGYTLFYVRASYIEQVTTLAPQIRLLKNANVVSYDSAFRNEDTWPAYQYLLPKVLFKTFNSTRNEMPASRVVISGTSWRDSKKLQAKLAARENTCFDLPVIIKHIISIFFDEPLPLQYRIDQSLWLLPEKTSFPLPVAVEPSP